MNYGAELCRRRIASRLLYDPRNLNIFPLGGGESTATPADEIFSAASMVMPSTLWQSSPQPLKARRKIISQQRFNGITPSLGTGQIEKAKSNPQA